MGGAQSWGAKGFCQSEYQSNNKLVEKRSEDVPKLKKKNSEARIRLGLRKRWFSDDVEKGICEMERG